ncbi:MAG: hypothetical protein HYX80_08725 [Chloroflexi bacterium]|nr:hypothetical protein [Chloroflexota bacterium]
MADTDKAAAAAEQEVQRIKRQVDLLDQRLDNIDSMVSAVAERVMSQLVSLNLTCPHCGKNIEIGLVGSQKPRR